MLPIGLRHHVDHVREYGDDFHGQITRKPATCEPDYGERPPGPQELTHPLECTVRVHVVEGGHGHNQVERRGCERVGEKVSCDVFDIAAWVVASSATNAGLVAVDRRHVANDPPQLAGQHSLAAADVQTSLATCRNGAMDHRVVVDVVVPPLPLSGHKTSCLQTRHRYHPGPDI